MKRYPISKASSLLGISEGLIRYYEKKGVLRYHRQEGSKYRNFDNLSLLLLQRCQMYRKYDWSVEEITELVNAEDPVGIGERLSQKEAVLEQSIRLQQALLEYGRRQNAPIRRIPQLLQTCSVETMPALYMHPAAEYESLDKRPGTPWFQALYAPFVENTMCACAEEARFHETVTFYMSILAPYAGLLGALGPEVTHVPEQPCICGVVEGDLNAGFLRPEVLQPLLALARERGLQPVGQVYFRNLLVAKTPGQDAYSYYMEAWLPVKDG